MPDALTVEVTNRRRHAETLLDYLVDHGPVTAADVVADLGWTRGRFDAAVRYAREQLCEELEVAIPAPTPDDGWLYRVTTDWRDVEAGASHTLGHIDSRLRSIYRDVGIVLPFLTHGSPEWRRANFLHKHVGNIVRTLKEIQ